MVSSRHSSATSALHHHTHGARNSKYKSSAHIMICDQKGSIHNRLWGFMCITIDKNLSGNHNISMVFIIIVVTSSSSSF